MAIIHAKLWDCNDDDQAYFLTRYSWYLSMQSSRPALAEGRTVIDYAIFREMGLWNYSLGDAGYTTDLLSLKTWIYAMDPAVLLATYGYASAAAAFEDCFVHLNTGEDSVTVTPRDGGTLVVTAYNPASPTASRIPGPWGAITSSTDWLMNIKAPILLDFFRLYYLVDYDTVDGVYWDQIGVLGFVATSPAGGLTFAKTKEHTSDDSDTYTSALNSFLDGVRVVLNADGKLSGINASDTYHSMEADANYPVFAGHVDFIMREFFPSYGWTVQWVLNEQVVYKNALNSYPTLLQLYFPQHDTSNPLLYYDDRAAITILAGYYMFHNANSIFLTRGYTAELGGNAFWADAFTYDIGAATSDADWYGGVWGNGWGQDGWEGCTLGIQYWGALGRSYGENLVLWRGIPNGSISGCSGLDATTTKTIPLDKTYRKLNADGTLGSPITEIDLMNWEGAVLIGGAGDVKRTLFRP